MRKDKIILFTSSHFYLAFPQYKAIIPELNDFKKVLLNVNELETNKIDNNYIKRNKPSEIFDIYIKIKPVKYVRFPFMYISYKKSLTDYLNKINPNLIITSSDMATSHKVMLSWCKRNKVPYIILQPSFIEGIPKKYGLICHWNVLLKVPLIRSISFLVDTF